MPNFKIIIEIKSAHSTRSTNYILEFNGKHAGCTKKAFERTAKRAGLKNVTRHTLKHTSITWMIQGGISIDKVSRITNTSAKTIEKHYGHHSHETNNAIIQAVSF